MDKRRWLSEEKLADLYAAAQCQPGIIAVNVAVLIASIVLMLLARSCYLPMLREMGTKGGSIVPALIVAVLIMGAITAGNVWAIRRKINSLWIQD